MDVLNRETINRYPDRRHEARYQPKVVTQLTHNIDMSADSDAKAYKEHQNYVRNEIGKLLQDRVGKIRRIADQQARLETLEEEANRELNRLDSKKRQGKLTKEQKMERDQLDKTLKKVARSTKGRSRNMRQVKEDTQKVFAVLRDNNEAKALDDVVHSRYDDQIGKLEDLLRKGNHGNTNSEGHNGRLAERRGSNRSETLSEPE